MTIDDRAEPITTLQFCDSQIKQMTVIGNSAHRKRYIRSMCNFKNLQLVDVLSN